MNSRIIPTKERRHRAGAREARAKGGRYGNDGFALSKALLAVLIVIALVAVVTLGVLLPSMLSAEPAAAFTADSMTGEAPFAVSFRDRSTGDIDAWSWDFGDGNTSSEQDPQHTYDRPGTYTVSLTVEGSGKTSECVKEGFIIAKQARPTADFTSSEHAGYAPLTVTFRDNSTGSPASWKWDFEDDGTYDAFTPEASHTYEEPGTYAVRLTVENAGGVDSIFRSGYVVVLSGLPVADFEANVTDGAAPLTVQFTDQSLNDPQEWEWDLDGDGNVDSYDQNPTWTYELRGTYDVTLTVRNSHGPGSVTKTEYITVTGEAPAASFTADNRSGDAPLTVHFTDQSTGTITNRTWDFGDGNVSYEPNPTHTYHTVGEYTAVLTVSNLQGSTSFSRLITVSGALPTPSFTSNVTEGTAPLAVQFFDGSGNTPTAWFWEFGDGDTSTEQNPSHTYEHAGNYTVSLTVTNGYGNDTVTKKRLIVVHSPQAPRADFTADNRSGEAPLTVHFTDRSANFPTNWTWAFGDGNVSYERNATHSYAANGTYDVTLTVRNAQGNDTMVRAGLIIVGSTSSPVAQFIVDNSSGEAPLTVHFTDQSTGTITNRTWDFGDGNVSYEQNPTHTYYLKGTYDVTLTVANAEENDSLSLRIVVTPLSPPTAAGFTTSETDGTVHFTDQSTGTITNRTWDFGDGNVSYEQNPTHTYYLKGTYTVTLTVANAGGSKDVTRQITVKGALPEAKFKAVVSQDPPLTVHFTDLSTNSPTSWFWEFDDGATSTEQNPTHTYNSAGNYYVRLSVSNANGSTDVLFGPISVQLQKPTADFWADPLDGTSGLEVHFTDRSAGTVTGRTWDFGDGATSTQRNPTHKYERPGTYNVTLTVSNSAGNNSLCRLGLIWVVAPETEWHAFQGGLDRSGVTDEALPVTSAVQKWSATVHSVSGGTGGLDGGIVAGDGKIFCVSVNGYVSAYDATSGGLLWDTDVGDPLYGHMLVTPAYDSVGKVLYVIISSSSDYQGCKVAALAASSGNVLRSTTVAVGQANTPVTYDEGRIYFGIYAEGRTGLSYYCLNATTLQVLWTHNSTGPGFYWNGAAVISRALVFSELDGFITSLDKYTGNIINRWNCFETFGVPWRADLQMSSSVSYSPELGMIYWTWGVDRMAIGDGYCLALGFDRGNGTFNSSKKWITYIGSSSSTPAVYGGRVYVGDGNSYSADAGPATHFRCLDALNGSILWSFTTESGVQSSAVISPREGQVYIYFTVNSMNSTLFCVKDLGDRAEEVWKYLPPANDRQYTLQGATPYHDIHGNGWLYYGNDKGMLFAVGAP